MLVFLLFKKESESDDMLTIEIKELNISEEVKKKIEFICGFCNTTPTIRCYLFPKKGIDKSIKNDIINN